MMKPIVIQVEDGSLLIEWISKNARFGISLEPNMKDSSWFYVHKNEEGACGELPQSFIEKLLEFAEANWWLDNTEPYGIDFKRTDNEK